MSLNQYAYASDASKKIILSENDFQRLFGDHTAWKSGSPLPNEYRFYPVSSPRTNGSPAEVMPNMTYVDMNTMESMQTRCEVYPISSSSSAHSRGSISNPSSTPGSPQHQARHGTLSPPPLSPTSAFIRDAGLEPYYNRGSPTPDTPRNNTPSSPYPTSHSPRLANQDHRSPHTYDAGDCPSPTSFPASPSSRRASAASGSRSPATRHATPVPLSRESRGSFSALYELGLPRPETDGSPHPVYSPGKFPAELGTPTQYASVSPGARRASNASNASPRSRHTTPTFGTPSPAASPRSPLGK